MIETVLNALTWERGLVLWGLIAPVVGGLFATWWNSTQTKANRDFEMVRWERQVEVEEKRRKEDEEREASLDIQRRMESAYARFLYGGMLLITMPRQNFGSPQKQEAISEFSAGFQRVLLVASNDCAIQAVTLWKKILAGVDSALPETERTEIDNEIRSLRAAFLREARIDLENPIERNANPGIKIEPVLKIGGFGLQDVG